MKKQVERKDIYVEKCYRVVSRGAIRALCDNEGEALKRADEFAKKRGGEWKVTFR